MTKDVFEARIALLEEMLAKAKENVAWLAVALESDRRLTSTEAGFAVALEVLAQWKAIENGEIARLAPIEMPRDESRIEP